MFACVYTPDLSVQAVLRQEHKQKAYTRVPAVILDGPPRMLRVASLNPPARAAGLRLGMTKLQAEACDGVLIRERSSCNEEAAQSALLQCADRLSPRVE